MTADRAVRPNVWPGDVALIRDPHNPMDVVGHDHKFIRPQCDFSPNFGRTEPFLAHDDAARIQPHFPVHHIPKQTFAILRANRDKIRPRRV